jgi:3-deoxy-D-arabino-heptulosonate 7-phosphate (DAHP) synthase
MEIVPGIKAKEIVTDAAEIASIKAKIAEQQITAIEEKERRIKAILDDVEKRLRNFDGPVRITDEMRELGIADKVWGMVQACELSRKFVMSLRDDEDDIRDFDAPESWID